MKLLIILILLFSVLVFLWSCVMPWMSQRKVVLLSTYFQYYWPPETVQAAKKKLIGKRNAIVDCFTMVEDNILQLNKNYGT